MIEKYLEVLYQEEIKFWMGNPTVELVSGSLFLQKIDMEKGLDGIVKQLRSKEPSNSVLAFQAISRSKSPLQICDFFGQFAKQIEQIKVLSTQNSLFYTMLLFFKSKQKANAYQLRMFGRQFNPIEEDIIIVREVRQIRSIKDYFNLDLPKLKLKRSQSQGNHQLFDRSKEQNCAICLQSIANQEDFKLSLLCSHAYHLPCLRQWKDNSCPQCRYHQHPPLARYCSKCCEQQGLWSCLTCGLEFCGGDFPLTQSHIRNHYRESGHKFALQILAKIIYDFEKKDYLHRFLQQSIQKDKSKLKSVQALIAAELDQQRQYFQARLQESKLSNSLQTQKLQIQYKELHNQNSQLQEHSLNKEREIQKGLTQLKTLNQKVTKLSQHLEALKKKNYKMLSQRDRKAQSAEDQFINRRQSLKRNIRQLQEQLKDLKAHKRLQAQVQVKKGGQSVKQTLILGRPKKR